MEHSFNDMVRYYLGYDKDKKQWYKMAFVTYLYFSERDKNAKLLDVIVTPIDTLPSEYNFYVNTDKSER